MGDNWVDVILVSPWHFPFIWGMIFALNQSNQMGIGLIEIKSECAYPVFLTTYGARIKGCNVFMATL